jgi:hypothetical protein
MVDSAKPGAGAGPPGRPVIESARSETGGDAEGEDEGDGTSPARLRRQNERDRQRGRDVEPGLVEDAAKLGLDGERDGVCERGFQTALAKGRLP